jgi:hypothetical protein
MSWLHSIPLRSESVFHQGLSQASEEDEKAIQKEKAVHIQRASEYRTACWAIRCGLVYSASASEGMRL